MTYTTTAMDGWLVSCYADKKEPASTKSSKASERRLSIANKKFMHYNDDVLIPFIKSICEALGWKPGQDIPEWMRAVSWFDGDIPQLRG